MELLLSVICGHRLDLCLTINTKKKGSVCLDQAGFKHLGSSDLLASLVARMAAGSGLASLRNCQDIVHTGYATLYSIIRMKFLLSPHFSDM